VVFSPDSGLLVTDGHDKMAQLRSLSGTPFPDCWSLVGARNTGSLPSVSHLWSGQADGQGRAKRMSPATLTGSETWRSARTGSCSPPPTARQRERGTDVRICRCECGSPPNADAFILSMDPCI
jgi:hypothetical protein